MLVFLLLLSALGLEDSHIPTFWLLLQSCTVRATGTANTVVSSYFNITIVAYHIISYCRGLSNTLLSSWASDH